MAFLYMPKPFAIPSQWSGTVLTVAFIVAFLGGCIGVCIGAYIANKLSGKSNQCMVVQEVSSDSKPLVSDAISEENLEAEQTDTTKLVDNSAEK